MKPRRSGKLRLIRPADAFLPAGLFIAALFTHPLILMPFLAYGFGIAALSLASCRGVRVAFAAQPSIRYVRGSVKAALLCQVGAALAGCGALKLLWPGFDAYAPLLAGAGLLMNIEHTFYEYLFATGDGGSATMVRAITSALTAAGLILCDTFGGEVWWLTGGAALSAAVASIIGIAIGGPLKGRLNGQVFRCAPRALIQTLLYPAIAAAILYFAPLKAGIAPAFVGLALYELCKTPFRRSAMEARSLNRALLIALIAAALLTAVGFVPAVKGLFGGDDMTLTGIMLAAAAVCAFALFGRVGGREA